MPRKISKILMYKFIIISLFPIILGCEKTGYDYSGIIVVNSVDSKIDDIYINGIVNSLLIRRKIEDLDIGNISYIKLIPTIYRYITFLQTDDIPMQNLTLTYNQNDIKKHTEFFNYKNFDEYRIDNNDRYIFQKNKIYILDIGKKSITKFDFHYYEFLLDMLKIKKIIKRDF